MSELYNRIAELCKNKGITITDMCRDGNIPRGSLTDLKNGRIQSLSADNISRIADYFGVPMEYVLSGMEKEKPLVNNDEELTEYLEMLKTRPETKMLFQLAKNATKEDVEKAVKIIEALKGND